MSCIFCSILEGSAPASIVYEDEAAVAFMDIRPTRPGQLVIIPRERTSTTSRTCPMSLPADCFCSGSGSPARCAVR